MTEIKSDIGTEFSLAFAALTDDGVNYTTSTPDTLESNGFTEKTHQTIMNDVRSCLTEVQLAEQVWNYALRHVVAARNTVPHSAEREIPFCFRLLYHKHVRQALVNFWMSRELQTQGESAQHIWF